MQIICTLRSNCSIKVDYSIKDTNLLEVSHFLFEYWLVSTTAEHCKHIHV